MLDDCLHLQPEPTGTPQFTWAKYHHPTGDWMPLFRHLDDTACVAWCLWEEWLSENAKQLVIHDCNGNATLAKKIAVLIAAGHDIGKHSSAFAMQVPVLKERMVEGGATFLPLSKDERKYVPHAIVSALSFIDWYQQAIEDNYLPAYHALASIIASHHGRFPNSNAVTNNAQYIRECSSLPQWHNERMGWWERAIATAGINDDELNQLRHISLSQPVQIILTGFLVMSDWIASNQELFPLIDMLPSDERADNALNTLNLPPQWQAAPPIENSKLFTTRFELPQGTQPRPVQESAMSLARGVDEPCLMLIEAPTGEGKTEAALAAGEILAEKFGLNGMTFALPTCATSDGIFPRITSWLGTTLPPGSSASAILTHGRANFNENYRELFSPKHIGNIYDEENKPSSIHAHWWLRGRKTSSLANFCVGTIDQVLFAALSSRHLMLRHVGLSGKVIIFDEIHASDTYMMVYLERVLEWLGAMGVPVIALSATLAPARRAALLTAYKTGACKKQAIRYRLTTKRQDSKHISDMSGYPLISIATAQTLNFEVLKPSGRTADYSIEFVDGDTSDIAEFIQQNATEGGCVGVICNTVKRAQAVYASLSNSFNEDELVLLHSRFVATERRRIEKALVKKLGPENHNRPQRLIVVSTQVIEQSLDIDFDLLYSDLAPIDLILQRAGRLHRHTHHNQIRPKKFQVARLALGGFKLSADNKPSFDSGSEAIYGSAFLLRSLATLLKHIENHGPKITSPNDVAPLVRSTYAEDLTPPEGWEELWETASKAQVEHETDLAARASVFCITPPKKDTLFDFDKAIAGEADDSHRGRAQVRDAEDTLEVILVQRIDGAIHSLPFLETNASLQLDMTAGLDEELAREVSMCTVTLPSFLLRGELGDRVISELENNWIDAWQQSRWLRGQLPLVLDNELKSELAGFEISYNPHLGLQISKPPKEN